MTEPDEGIASRECRSLYRYLVRTEPSDAVKAAYARGLNSASFREGYCPTPLDDVLLSLAAAGPRWAGLADAWARLFAPAGQLRRRLVLLLAIIESRAPECEVLEPGRTSRLLAFSSLVLAGFGFVLRLLIAVPILLPLHVTAAIRGRNRSDAARGGTAS